MSRLTRTLAETNLRHSIKLGRPSRLIVTLDPNKLAEKKQQPFDIGYHSAFITRVVLPKRKSLPSIISYDFSKTRKATFPPHTKAFLYYTTSPEKPRIAGELRLRVTSSNDPASFESGSDLIDAEGQPWSRPLYSLSKYYIPLYEKLKEDRLLPDDLVTALSTFPSKRCFFHRSQLLYRLNDTFTIDFSKRRFRVIVITEQGVESLNLGDVFSDLRSMHQGRRPYTGSVLARFERSTLPEHKGTRTVVIRFLKIITPVKCVIPSYDGYLCWPKEGELYQRSYLRQKFKNKTKVWSVDLDKSTESKVSKRGFQLLWDA